MSSTLYSGSNGWGFLVLLIIVVSWLIVWIICIHWNELRWVVVPAGFVLAYFAIKVERGSGKNG